MLVREAIDGALQANYLELAVDSAQWPTDASGAKGVKLQVRSAAPTPASGAVPRAPGVLVAEAELDAVALQDLADQVGAILTAAVGHDLRFRLRVELSGAPSASTSVVAAKVNEALRQVSERLVLS
jgi:hypothetical protein